MDHAHQSTYAIQPSFPGSSTDTIGLIGKEEYSINKPCRESLDYRLPRGLSICSTQTGSPSSVSLSDNSVVNSTRSLEEIKTQELAFGEFAFVNEQDWMSRPISSACSETEHKLGKPFSSFSSFSSLEYIDVEASSMSSRKHSFSSAGTIGSGNRSNIENCAGISNITQMVDGMKLNNEPSCSFYQQQPQQQHKSSVTQRMFADVNPQKEDILALHRQKLLDLVNYYKKKFNNGYGLIPIINSFTAKHKFQHGDYGAKNRYTDGCSRLLAMLESNQNPEYQADFLRGFNCHKKKDFCSKMQVVDGMKTVLFEVEFVKKGRWGLFQGVDFLVETGEPLMNLIDQPIVMEMDGGVDLAILRTVEYMPLLSGIQEVPFMPVLRRPTHFDRMKYETKDQDEAIVLRFCRELLKYPEFMHYNMNVTDVEFQIDRKKLIIYGEFVTKVKFNKYVKQVYEHCKQIFRKRNIKPRVFIQNKFVGAVNKNM